jgi:hypothetical protein
MESEECGIRAGLRNCDFTQAKMNLCSFWNCRREDLKLPGWPHVTIFDPAANAEDFKQLSSDPLLAWIQQLMEIKGSRTAIIYDLPKFLKQETPRLRKRWDLLKLCAKAKGESPPPELVLSVEGSRQRLVTRPYVYM